MIKNLLNADEEPPEGTKVIVEETIVPPATTETSAGEPAKENAPAPETRQVFEIPEDARFFRKDASDAEPVLDEAAIEAALAEIGVDVHAETDVASADWEKENRSSAVPPVAPVETPKSEPAVAERKEEVAVPSIFQSSYPEKTETDDTIRNTGLAYTAAIVLFGGVVLMMIFGWLVDLLLGTSPWGIVGGIILGGIIGFVQFFRITSSIFRK